MHFESNTALKKLSDHYISPLVWRAHSVFLIVIMSICLRLSSGEHRKALTFKIISKTSYNYNIVALLSPTPTSAVFVVVVCFGFCLFRFVFVCFFFVFSLT